MKPSNRFSANAVTLAFPFLVATMFSCTSPTKPADGATSMNKQQITDSILRKMNHYGDVLNRQDSAALISCYVAGDEFRLYSDGQVFSYEKMKKLAGGLKTSYSSVHASWDTILVTLPSNTVALATAPFHRRLVDKAGNTIEDRGVANWLFVFRDGQWKMLYGSAYHQPVDADK